MGLPPASTAEVEVFGTGPNGKATVTGTRALEVFCNGGSTRCEYRPTGAATVANVTGGLVATFKVSGEPMKLFSGTAGCRTETSLSMFQPVKPASGSGGAYIRT